MATKNTKGTKDEGVSWGDMRLSITHRGGALYDVTIHDADGTSTSHVVTVWPSDVARYAPDSTPEELLEASFKFLLEREAKESILARFELPVIERYFPEYRAIVASMV
jgi:hypothetical protein